MPIPQNNHNYNLKLGSWFENTRRFHYYTNHRLTLKELKGHPFSVLSPFWGLPPRPTNNSQFRYHSLVVDQPKELIGDPLNPSKKYLTWIVLRSVLTELNYINFRIVTFLRISFQKAILACDLITLRVWHSDALYNSYSVLGVLHSEVWKMCSDTFFCHALNRG